MSRRRHINITIGMRLLPLLSIPLLAADWPGWRGPHRDGVITEEPKAYPERLNLKWKTEIGLGHSSPILAAGSIYAFARQGEQETVYSIDPATGKIRWQRQYPAPYKMNSAATSMVPARNRRLSIPTVSSTHSESAAFSPASMPKPENSFGARNFQKTRPTPRLPLVPRLLRSLIADS